MKTIKVEQLGRAGVGIAEQIGYKAGAKAVIQRVSKWLDEDTIQSLYEEFEIKEEE